MSRRQKNQPQHSKLNDLIRCIVSEFEGDFLTRTKLIKLLYLSDRQAKDNLGEKISDTSYIRYHYGPYSEELMDAIEELDGSEIYENQGRSNSGNFYLYEPSHQIQQAKSLSDDERAVIEDILEEYATLDTEELVDRVYDEYGLHDVAKYTEIL